jgi:hypothetical protein
VVSWCRGLWLSWVGGPLSGERSRSELLDMDLTLSSRIGVLLAPID